MTKLEELRADADAACGAYKVAWKTRGAGAASDAAYVKWANACDAYYAELKKEKQND